MKLLLSVSANLAVLLVGFGLASCGPKAPVFQNEAYKADSNIQNSFGIVAGEKSVGNTATPPLKADKARISIAKSALEKEFLLSSNIIQQLPAVQFNGLKSRVVVLRLVDTKVFLIEASKGLVVPRDVNPSLILAEFPVLSQNDDSVTFDFNAGMSRIFMTSDWYVRDDEGMASQSNYMSVKAAFSYIESAVFSKANVLEIHQVAQVESTAKDGSNVAMPIEVVYYLSPYSPDPKFTPTKAPKDMRQMGFFEVSPVYNVESGTDNYASKHNLNKPIVYAISANTPADFKQAVRDGILYWNKAFGKNVIQVVEAPAGVTAPTSEYNIVQWVDWNSAGSAYADAQMDPRTGEILHHQIYFTSAFADIGKARGNMYLREFLAKGRKKQPRLKLAGFERQDLCDLTADSAANEALLKVLEVEQDQAKVLKAVQDYLREVVAHEVGHTLGLRHNFAGSLAANYAANDRDRLFKEYFLSGKAPEGMITTSSVMEYSATPESMISGDHIAKGPKALSYDEEVIQALYYDKSFSREEMSLFCTDSQLTKYLDCRQGDAGASIVDWHQYTLKRQLNNLPLTVLEAFIAAKNPVYGAAATALEEVELDAKTYAKQIATTERMFVKVLEPKARLLKVDRKFPFVNSTNDSIVRAEFVKTVLGEINTFGSLDAMFLNPTYDVAGQLQSKFEALLSNPKLTRGIGPDGKPYEFSGREIEVMKARGKQLFSTFAEELVKTEVEVLAGVPDATVTPPTPPAEKFLNNPLADAFVNFLAKRQEHYVLATSGEPVVYTREQSSDWSGSDNMPKPVKSKLTLTLPRFTYPLEVRKTAATILAGTRAEGVDWAFPERVQIQAEFDKMIEKALEGPIPEESSVLVSYPRPAIVWIKEAQEVKQALGKD